MDVRDLRSTERFVVKHAPLSGSYGSASISVLNLSIQGAQIEHAQPLRLGTRARFWFKRGDVAISVQAMTIWSHLSRTPNDKGKYLYHSGLRVETVVQLFADAIQGLLDDNVIAIDTNSLDRKRKREIDRAASRTGRPVVRLLRPDADIPNDQALLIQHARDRLRAEPDEAQRWYQRAKYAITHGGENVIVDGIPNREEVLAVWEYLERSVEIGTIVRVFERKKVE
ncbi:MAG TPA: hypothetical protein VF190_05860 [Rhodothermales bacterium]